MPFIFHCQNREHIFKLIDLQYPLTKTIASLPPLDHDKEVIVGVEVAELVVAPEREPEVGAEVELAVVPQVRGQRHLYSVQYSVQCSVHASAPLYRGGAGPAAHHGRLFQRFAQSSANVPASRSRGPGH